MSNSKIKVPNITLRVMVPSIVILELEFDEPLVTIPLSKPADCTIVVVSRFWRGFARRLARNLMGETPIPLVSAP